jgi:hypothetical protein
LSLIGGTRDCVVITHADVHDRDRWQRKKKGRRISKMSSPSWQTQKQVHARPH